MSDEIYYGGEREKNEAGETVVYAPAKDFFRWFDDFGKPYEPLLKALSDEFGTTFAMSHTGGGCMAIEAAFENNVGIMITDAEDVLDRDNWDGRYGYTVGVYPIVPCDCWLPPGVQLVDGKPVNSRWSWTGGEIGQGEAVRLETPFEGELPAKCEHPDSANTCEEALGYVFSKEAKSPAQLIALIKLAVARFPASGERKNDMQEVDLAMLQFIDPKLAAE
jgi:hypothetical protein